MEFKRNREDQKEYRFMTNYEKKMTKEYKNISLIVINIRSNYR